jgi:hypothetical protein
MSKSLQDLLPGVIDDRVDGPEKPRVVRWDRQQAQRLIGLAAARDLGLLLCHVDSATT